MSVFTFALITGALCFATFGGACGWMLRGWWDNRADRRPGLITDKLPIDWEWPTPPRPYDHAAEKQFADAMDKAAGQ